MQGLESRLTDASQQKLNVNDAGFRALAVTASKLQP